MRPRRLALIAATAVALAVSAQIQWNDTICDFGVIDEDLGKASAQISFVNIGSDDVAITKVRPTCGCTAGQFSRRAIAPGDTGTITLIYDPEGRPGPFEKDVIVTVTSEPQRHMIKIKGRVIGAEHTVRAKYPEAIGQMRFVNTIASFGEIHKGRNATGSLQAYNAGRDSLAIEVISCPEYISPVVSPKRIAPGQTAAVALFYESGKCDEWGIVNDTLALSVVNLATGESSVGEAHTVALLTEDAAYFPRELLAAQPRINRQPEVLAFENISAPNADNTRYLTIENVGKGTLEVRRIVSYDKAVIVAPDRLSIEAGHSEQVAVSIDPSLVDTDTFSTELLLICNDVGTPNVKIRVAATK